MNVPNANGLPPYATDRKQLDLSTVHSESTPGDSQKTIQAWAKVQTLEKIGVDWFIDKHDGAGPQLIVGNSYDPDFRVRGFILGLSGETVAILRCNTPYSVDVTTPALATGIEHPGWLTRIWTDDLESTFDTILLLG